MNVTPDEKRRNDALAERIASVLHDIRVEKEFTQDQLAVRAGLSRTSLGDVEQARKAVTAQKLLQILSALDVTMSDFFRRVEQSEQM